MLSQILELLENNDEWLIDVGNIAWAIQEGYWPSDLPFLKDEDNF